MEMTSIFGKFFLAFAFAFGLFSFTVLYHDPRIMANPGLAFCGWETCLLDSLPSLSDANQWLPLLYHKKVTWFFLLADRLNIMWLLVQLFLSLGIYCN